MQLNVQCTPLVIWRKNLKKSLKKLITYSTQSVMGSVGELIQEGIHGPYLRHGCTGIGSGGGTGISVGGSTRGVTVNDHHF